MRKLLTAFLLMTLVITGSLFASDQIKQVNRDHNIPSFLGYAQDRLIVVMKDSSPEVIFNKSSNDLALSGNASLDAVAAEFAVSKFERQFQGSEKSSIPAKAALSKYYKVTLNAGELDDAVKAYEALPEVDHVEKVGIHSMFATPNDGYFDPYQWYHNQTNDDDIDSPEAWDIQTGSSSTILAILDSGTRYYHRDLGGANGSPSNVGAARGNMWINDAELNGSAGVDDDGNGYTDDWIGYDFISSTSQCWPGEDCGTKDNDPRDFNGHGTHTAGIVGMITNNGYGMAGVAGGWGNGSEQEYGNGVKVMACRMGFSYNYLGQEYGVVYMDAAAEAFYYAADNGASIASCSWGSSNSGGIGAAADYFLNAGGLIFVAAGNDGSQTADYLNGRSDIISVAATDQNDGAASFTTYGTWVDISAPGVGIYSTLHDHTDPNTDYWASMDGTSMACPMAAAVGAMIWSQNPSWTAAQVKSQLYSSAENIDSELSSTYLGKMGAGRINLYDAVNTGPPPPPVANFSGTPTTGTEPLTVNFTDLSTGSIDTWSWTFGDGGTSSAQNPTYEYTSAGTYNVTLTVTGPGGSDGETKNGYITVNPCVTPTAGFVGTPTSGDYPLNVSFTDQSTGASSYSWDFGDGVGTSTQANPSYTYTSAGTFTVTQTVTNACGSDQMVRTNYITVTTPPPPPPTAEFVGSPTSGDFPLTVNFTDLSTDAPTSWTWDFGDGVGTSTAQNPSYIYNNVGTYTVSLTATNAYGSDVETKIDYITVTEPTTAEGAFAQSETSVLGTFSGSFANTYASDNSYEVITEALSTSHPRKTTSNAEHQWTFNVGGGTTVTFFLEAYRSNNSDGDNFVFEYSTDGSTWLPLVTVASATEQVYSYSLPANTSGTVYVKTYDSNRSWDLTSLDDLYIDQMYIEYESTPGPPVADFSGTPTSGPYPLNVSFSDLSTGSPTSWSWDFGDGVGTSTAQNPSYTYNNIGVYTVTLTATNAYGSDGETKVGYINVTDQASGTIHVANMTVGRAKSGPNSYGTCTVTIQDDVGGAVANATVYVTASGPTGGSYNGVTGADGSVSFQTATGAKRPPGEWCFEVTNVTHGTFTYDSGSNAATYTCESGVVYSVGSGDLLAIPTEYSVTQNYPNPFNPATEIGFNLPKSTHVSLVVYNLLGQEIETLVDGELGAGSHSVTFDATQYSSGIYFYRLQTNDFAETKKMVLVK